MRAADAALTTATKTREAADDAEANARASVQAAPARQTLLAALKTRTDLGSAELELRRPAPPTSTSP